MQGIEMRPSSLLPQWGAWDFAFSGALCLTFWVGSSLAWPFGAAARVYALVEAAFLVYGKYRYAVLNRLSDSLPDAHRSRTAMRRFLELHRVFEMEEFLSGWFFGAEASAVMRSNLEELVIYGFYALPPDQLSSEERAVVQQFLSEVESRWRMTLPHGYNADAKFMSHAWEPLKVAHKPLIVYCFTELAAKAAQLLLRLMGFSKSRLGRFSCWTALPEGTPAAGKAHGAPMAPQSRTAAPTHHHPTADVMHAAAEHALDAAVTAASAAAASVAHQHSQQQEKHQYHFPDGQHSRGGSLTAAEGGLSGFSADCGPAVPAAGETVGLSSSGLRLRPLLSPGENAPHAQLSTTAGAAAGAVHPGGGGALHRKSASLPHMHHFNSAAGGLARPATAAVPIVFLHGVGFGVLPYLHFVRRIMQACPASPVVVLEMPHVALRLCRDAASVDEVAAAAVAAVRRLGATQACFVAHSYGTLVASRIVQLYPAMVQSLALLDPVCLLTCYPQLLYNFVYRPLTLDSLTSLSKAFDTARYLCSRDLTIAQAFSRRFHWCEMMLWPDDLPAGVLDHVLLVLSGKDDLVPAELVQSQFAVQNHHARIIVNEHLGHGGLLLEDSLMQEVVEGIAGMMQPGSSQATVSAVQDCGAAGEKGTAGWQSLPQVQAVA